MNFLHTLMNRVSVDKESCSRVYDSSKVVLLVGKLIEMVAEFIFLMF